LPSTTDLHFDGPPQAKQTLALAHGAGAGMDTNFMNTFATAIGRQGIRVARFEFPYMAAYRKTRERRPPDRQPILIETWLKVVEALGPKHLIIGGKSMGGRIASMVADQAGVAALLCLGYPFHPVGKPDVLRVEHLRQIKTSTLIVQGARDPFGNREEVAGYELATAITLHWMEDGDHDFKPRKSSGRTQPQNWDEAIAAAAAFIKALS
jgi:predicted alpha/beta-hydrolase family hydrolase